MKEPGVVYKVLRSLEDGGSIRSTWSTQESGPARRYYEITESGTDLLDHHVDNLTRQKERIGLLLEEYAALTGPGAPADGDGRAQLVAAETTEALSR